MSVGKKLIEAASGVGGVDTGDDDFANVVLLLDGDGTSGDDNNAFTDSSTNGYTITESGSVVQGSFSPYRDNWSVYFDGVSTDYLSVSDAIDFDFGTGDFTVECFFYETGQLSSFSMLGACEGVNQYFGYGTIGTGGMTMYAGSSGTDIYSGSSNNPEPNQWNHLVWQRNSGRGQMYLNGTRVYDAVYSADFGSTATGFQIGRSDYYSNYYAKGYISNFRVVNGEAVYSGSIITVPTAPLTDGSYSNVNNLRLLTCHSNRFKDDGTDQLTVSVNGTPKVTPFSPFKNDDARDITTDGGSAYWDGSSYLDTASGATALGTGAFTVEFWINTTDTSFNIMNPDSSTGNGFWGLMVQSGDLRWNNQYALTNLWVVDGAPILDGAWHHVAIVSSSSVFKVFYDGVSQSSQSGSFNDSYNYPYSDGLRIGSGNLATFTGYLSDIRLLAGTALYSSDFTPPTAPLTAVTNTKLLMNFQDAGIYDRSGINNIDTVGNAQIDTAVVKYGSGSMQLDGSGDYLKIPHSEELNFGTDDFTIEMWVSLTSGTQDNDGIIAKGETGTGWQLIWNNTNEILFIRTSGNASSPQMGSGSNTVSKNGTWYHVAITRSGSTVRMFLDGTQVDTYTDSTSWDTTDFLGIGANRSENNLMTGYIDDLRITKGIARYTSNFTAPDAALPNF